MTSNTSGCTAKDINEGSVEMQPLVANDGDTNDVPDSPHVVEVPETDNCASVMLSKVEND